MRVLHSDSRDQEVKLRRHNQGIAAISVLSTNMAVLGEESRVSLWVLGNVINTPHYSSFAVKLAKGSQIQMKDHDVAYNL